MAQWRHMLSAG